MDSRLIIIRGNSGSGKTTVAKELIKKLGPKAMLISQDIVRRDILRVKDTAGNPAIALIYDMTMFGNAKGYTIVLEGIFNTNIYGSMFDTLVEKFDGPIFCYYFDIPYEETVTRHASKRTPVDFSTSKLKTWWKDKDYLGLDGEKLLNVDHTKEDIIQLISEDTKHI